MNKQNTDDIIFSHNTEDKNIQTRKISNSKEAKEFDNQMFDLCEEATKRNFEEME